VELTQLDHLIAELPKLHSNLLAMALLPLDQATFTLAKPSLIHLRSCLQALEIYL
jgi:hypothetical protein